MRKHKRIPVPIKSEALSGCFRRRYVNALGNPSVKADDRKLYDKIIALSAPRPAGASARAQTMPVAALIPIISSLVAADCKKAAEEDVLVARNTLYPAAIVA